MLFQRGRHEYELNVFCHEWFSSRAATSGVARIPNMFVNCITSTFELLRIAIKKKVAHFNIPGVPLLRHKYNSNDFHVVRHVTMGGVKEIIYSSVYIDKA